MDCLRIGHLKLSALHKNTPGKAQVNSERTEL